MQNNSGVRFLSNEEVTRAPSRLGGAARATAFFLVMGPGPKGEHHDGRGFSIHVVTGTSGRPGNPQVRGHLAHADGARDEAGDEDVDDEAHDEAHP